MCESVLHLFLVSGCHNRLNLRSNPFLPPPFARAPGLHSDLLSRSDGLFRPNMECTLICFSRNHIHMSLLTRWQTICVPRCVGIISEGSRKTRQRSVSSKRGRGCSFRIFLSRSNRANYHILFLGWSGVSFREGLQEIVTPPGARFGPPQRCSPGEPRDRSRGRRAPSATR